MTPAAPAAFALATTLAELHTPEKVVSTILPVTLLVMRWHASSKGAVVSAGITRSPRRSKLRGPEPIASLASGPSGPSSDVVVGADHKYIRIRGRAPSPGVDMLALLRLPMSAPACASTSNGSFATPPRPKLSRWALCVASVKPESYHQSCSQLTMKNALTVAAFA